MIDGIESQGDVTTNQGRLDMADAKAKKLLVAAEKKAAKDQAAADKKVRPGTALSRQ